MCARPLWLALAILGGALGWSGCSQSVTQIPTAESRDRALAQARAQVAEGVYTAAEATLSSILDSYPADPLPALELTDLYEDWGRPNDGLEALNIAASRNAPQAEVAPRRLRLLADAGRWQDVTSEAEAQLASDPTTLEALAALTEAQLHQGACQEARLTARQASMARPTDADLASIDALLSGDYARLAATAPNLMADLLPCEDRCNRAIGLRLARDGRWDLAACVLAQAAVASPEDAEIQTWLGEAYARIGLPEEAERAFGRAVARDSQLPEAWLLLGKLLLADGRLEEAREALLRAQALDSGNPAPCLAVAELKAQMGLYDEMDRWTQAALARAPADAEIAKAVARIYLSRRLADNGTAVSAVDLAIRLAPNDGEATTLLGASHLLRGDVAAALAALDDAVTVSPGLGEAHFWRARALDASGRLEEAAAARTRAADLGWPTAGE